MWEKPYGFVGISSNISYYWLQKKTVGTKVSVTDITKYLPVKVNFLKMIWK